MSMTEDNIKKLLEDIPNHVSDNDVFNAVGEKIDLANMVMELRDGKLTVGDACKTFAYAGFLEGVEFALRNLEED